MTAQGKLVVISGPSGAGKTSVCKALKQQAGVDFSVSATTRAMRPGEIAGVDYHFLAYSDFEARAKRGEFLEWASYNGNLYGTPSWPMDAAIARGRTFLLEIEVKGTKQLREQRVPGLYLFIAPPNLAALRERLERRGANTPADIAARVRIAEEEIVAAGSDQALYDHILVNEDLAATIRRGEELIRS